MKDGFFGTASLGRDNENRWIMFVLEEPVSELDRGMVRWGRGYEIGNDGPIGFADIAIAKLFGEARDSWTRLSASCSMV